MLERNFVSRYALVNIVMGDIADIEKKKSKGLSTLLLGAKPNQMVQVVLQKINCLKNKEIVSEV